MAEHEISTDAVPSSARPSQAYRNQHEIQGHNDHQNNESENNGNNFQRTQPLMHLPEPPTDWQFNVFLQKIADNLTTDDLHSMKGLFHGDGGIGRGVLEKMEKPLDFFRILRTRGYISRDNLLYLQIILFCAGRKDLVKDAVEYARTIEDVLHFYTPSDQPENGYRHVKFHVDGKDFRNASRSDIENVRNTVAKLLFVPREFVFIQGIEPSLSLVITLMIPEMYVDILHDLLEEGDDFADLQDVGVDIVEIDGITPYTIKDSCQGVKVETEQQIKLANVYDQLKQTKARLDGSEEAIIELSHEIDHLHSKLTATEDSLSKTEGQVFALERVLSMSKNESKPATLRELSSLKEFTESLHHISLESVDRKVVQRLINATVNIVSTRVKDSHRIQEQKLLLELQDVQSKLVPLMYEVERYKFMTNLSNIDEKILGSLQQLLQSLLAPSQIQQERISLTPHGLQIMKKITSKLRHKEKEKLRQKYQWSPEGDIEKFMEQDPNYLIAGLLFKEIERRKSDINAEQFIAQCLTEVKRDDLKKFLEQKPSSNPQSPRYNTGARQRQAGQSGQQGQQQQRPSWQQQQHQQESAQGQQYKQQQHDQTDLIARMAQQINEMYNMLQSKQDVLNSKYEPWKTPSFPFDPQSFQQNQTV